MVKFWGDSPSKYGREITFSYDPDNDNDEKLIDLIHQTISDNQPECFNCKNYYKEGCFGDYQASWCRIYGCLEAVSNPHYDADGSKCKDYQRQDKQF